MKPATDIPAMLLLFGIFMADTPPVEKAPPIPSHPLQNENDLDVLLEKIGDRRIVLLGEASHGTKEYYEWRTAISKRLIREKGFNIIAVEGEWADSYRVNRFVKGPKKDRTAAVEQLREYDRWPTWMWANEQVADLITWLNNNNQNLPEHRKTGFFGLDVYCLWESMQELMPYIKDDENLVKMANDVGKCFRPYSADPSDYAYAVARLSASCRNQTEALHDRIMARTGGKTAADEAGFVMQQNTLVAKNGEKYYRTSVKSYPESWNVRDRHMMETIRRLIEFHGPDAKIIIWEHNTHVGDARQTNMAADKMVNVGQLVREEYGDENVFIVGFGSYKGTVTAASNWGGRIETMRVPAAKKGSWEDILHHSGEGNRIILSEEIARNKFYMKPWGHRAIGVVYHPDREGGNYVPSVIPKRYDAFLYIDETSALQPLKVTPKNEPPDTYPFGV